MKNPYGDFIRTEYLLIQRRQNFLILKNILIINEDVFVILLLRFVYASFSVYANM